MKKIKALLLSAGFGTRLRPLTLKTPKCLVKVNGVPLLSHWLLKLEKLGCEEVIINTHYLSHKVLEFLDSYKSKKLKIITSYEKEILGTAGTLMKHIEFFENSTGLLIHADNYTNDNLTDFLNSHYLRPKNCIVTMLTFDTADPKSCGIVQKDKDGRVIEFYEKSDKDFGKCANGAIYVFDNEFIKMLKNLSYEIKDFSLDVLPLMIGKTFSFHTKEIFMDIGTEASLKKANLLASLNKYQEH